MIETETLLHRLRALSKALGSESGFEVKLHDLAAAAALALNAGNCSIMLLREDEGAQLSLRVAASHGDLPPAAYAEKAMPGQGIAGRVVATGRSLLLADVLESEFAADARRPDVPGRSALCSPIRVNGNCVGVVNVSGSRGRVSFTPEDLCLLDVLALFIGRSHQVTQLQNLLKSRYIQSRLAESTEKAIGDALLSAGQHPDKMARTVAKSFYREMTKAGFSPGQIVDAATEVISELSKSLQKHRKRIRRRDD